MKLGKVGENRWNRESRGKEEADDDSSDAWKVGGGDDWLFCFEEVLPKAFSPKTGPSY